MPVATGAAGRRLERAITLLASLSWLAALVHAVVAPEHWREYRPFGICFAVTAVLQLAWAARFFLAPSRPLLALGAALSLGLLAVWTISRTTGLPVGPDAGTPEPVGVPDLAAGSAEAALIAGVVLSWRGWPAPAIPRWFLPLGSAVLVAGGVTLFATGPHAH